MQLSRYGKRLRVSLFGTIGVADAFGATIEIPASCWPLLVYLLVHRGSKLERGRVAVALWPDSDEFHARRSLSTAVWRLRRVAALAPHVRADRSEEIAIDEHAPLLVDAEVLRRRYSEFRASGTVDRGPALRRLKRAVEAVQEPALPMLDADWAIVKRQQYAELVHDALYSIAAAEFADGRWDQCVHFASRLSILEPLREDVHRLLMRAHLANGNRAKAIQQYRVCQGELGAELGVEPMEETQALYRSLATERKTSQDASAGLRLRTNLESSIDRVGAARHQVSAAQRELEAVADLLRRAVKLVEPPSP